MVLSTTYTRERSRQSALMPARSVTCVRGLAMVSTNTSLVSGRSAAATASVLVASTKATSTPCTAKLRSRLLVLPNRKALETM